MLIEFPSILNHHMDQNPPTEQEKDRIIESALG